MRTFSILAICLLAAHASASQPDQARPPNILLIMADDLGLHELGSYGQEKIQTPNLDRLASRGMRFTRAYSGSTVCAPSRAVLLTAKHTGHAAIRGNKEVGGWGPEEPEGQWPLPAEEITIAEILKDRGYATAAFGKWGLGGPGSVGHPNNQGFDHFYGYLCQRVAHNYYPTHLWRNHDVDVLHENDYFPAHQRIKEPLASDTDYDQYHATQYAPEEIIKEAESVIDAHAKNDPDQPLFVYYASVIPHAALQAPPEFVDLYPRDWDQEPYLGDRGYLPTPRPRATYAAMITFFDHAVGRLLDRLEANDMLENTIVIVTSDNGTTFNAGVDRAFFNSLADLRGFKTNLHEGGIRVSLIIAYPPMIAPASTSDLLCAAQDILPTLCELTNTPIPDNIDGLSLLPTLRADPAAQQSHDFLYFEFPEGNQQQAIIFNTGMKAIRKNLRKGNTVLELYDLNADPTESTDIAGDHPGLIAEIERILRAARTPNAMYPIKVLDDQR